MARIVMASKRFRKEYPQFLRKYSDLEATFRKFLEFRDTARPDQSFNAKDGRLSGTKFFGCHLIHGKAILIYQLHGAEIRLIALGEHDMLGNTYRIIRTYARNLASDDYHRFDVDAPEPITTTEPLDIPMEEAPTPIVDEIVQPTIVEPAVAEPVAPAAADHVMPNPAWVDTLVHYQHGARMLYKPRPANPMLVLQLTHELIAPAGDFLAFDLVNQAVHHLTRNELDAHFECAEETPATLSEAMATVMEPRPAPVEPSKPSSRDEPIEEEEVEQDEVEVVRPAHKAQEPIRTTARRHNVGAQLGRLVMTCAYLQDIRREAEYDTATIAHYLSERDRRSISAVMVNAQNAGLLRKAGRRPGGRGFLYALTREGLRTSRRLGDWPYTVAGLDVPRFMQHAVAAE